MGQKYHSYRNALNKLNLENLNDRREILCLNFAQRSSKHPTMKKMFPLNKKTCKMSTRNPEEFKVQYAINERLKNSPIIYMQNLMNRFGQKRKKIEENRKNVRKMQRKFNQLRVNFCADTVASQL